MKKQTNIVKDFENLPYRIFLDSNILQNLQNYGEFIWENIQTNLPVNQYDNIIALKNIFSINFRASFEFALSENSIREISDKKDKTYLQWCYDLLDHWMSCIESYENSEAFSGEGRKILQQINDRQFSYLSKKDKAILFDAIILECHALLTMDKKLWQNKEHLEKKLPIKILQPFEYWEILKPYAGLWM